MNKGKGFTDRIFLEVAVLGGAAEALTRMYEVVVPPSVVHRLTLQHALPDEVRTWLETVLQDPSSGVTIGTPQNPPATNRHLPPSTREAMQLPRENPGSVVLIGARWAFGEAVEQGLPLRTPSRFLYEAHQQGLLDFEKVADKLAALSPDRLPESVGPIPVIADDLRDVRTGVEWQRELEACRESGAEYCVHQDRGRAKAVLRTEARAGHALEPRAQELEQDFDIER